MLKSFCFDYNRDDESFMFRYTIVDSEFGKIEGFSDDKLFSTAIEAIIKEYEKRALNVACALWIYLQEEAEMDEISFLEELDLAEEYCEAISKYRAELENLMVLA